MDEAKTQTAKKETAEGQPKTKTLAKGKYVEGVGRRKRAVARVRIHEAKGQSRGKADNFIVNGKSGGEYFISQHNETALEPLTKLNLASRFSVTVRVRGGGASAQAEAVRLGLARALVTLDPLLRPRLKQEGYLTRDPREKERRKYGLKKARRAPQFSKR